MKQAEVARMTDRDDELHPRPDALDPGPDQRRHDIRGGSFKRVLNGTILVLVLAALAVLAWGTLREFFPRRWAEEVVRVVDGNLLRGLAAGVGVGFVFTLIPTLVLAQARRRVLTWTSRAIILVLALLLAMPNWLTLGVELGTTTSAVDGRVLLTESGPGFRTASAVGAVVGLLVALVLTAFSMRLSHRRRQVASLRAQVSDLERRYPRDED